MFALSLFAINQNVLTIVMLVAVVVIFYFFLIRPQKKQEQAQQQMRSELMVGDEVTTIGGIIGKITSLKGETVTIETSKDKTKIRFLKTAIRSVDVKAEESVVPVKTSASAATDKAVSAPADDKVDNKADTENTAQTAESDEKAENTVATEETTDSAENTDNK